MQKTIGVWIALVLVLLASCSTDSEFTLQGELSGSVRDTLTLEEMNGQQLDIVRSVITDENGFFSLTDTATNPRLLFLSVPGNPYITLMALGGRDITIKADVDDIQNTIQIEGSPESEQILELNRELVRASIVMDTLNQRIQEAQQAGTVTEVMQQVQAAYQMLRENQRTFIREFIDQHYSSPSSLLALSHKLGRQSVLDPDEDLGYFKKVDEALFKKYPESQLVQSLHQYVETVSIQQSSQPSPGSWIGKEAPEIELSSPDGEAIALSSLRGKHVLLDFWAAWCGPCRRENPNLVKAYKEFKDQGFEIYQVSLDRTREDWLQAIEDDQLDWIHVSDLKYWNSEAARLYGVQSIPASFLIDPEGKIIAQNLRGAALENKLKEVLE